MLRDVMRWDDALDVWSIHGMGGFYGSIALGFLADEASPFFLLLSCLSVFFPFSFHFLFSIVFAQQSATCKRVRL